MSKADGNGTSQSWERASQPARSKTSWDQGQQSAHVKLSDGPEDVSPRSQGAIPLNERHQEETRKKPQDARAEDSPSLGPHNITGGPKRSSLEKPVPSAAAALNSVSPELLTELRKIIREEFETLKGDTKESAGGVTEKSSRPFIVRERPSSPVQPFVNAAGVFIHAYPAKDTEDKKTSASIPSPTKSSSPRVEQKDAPRASTVRFSDETKPAEPTSSRSEEARKASIDSHVEMTAIDMRWGVLFEKDGSHTKRMEHVLRGLANYIVEEFMPQKSIVIPAEKMAAFYSQHRLEKEPFPLAALFRARSKDFNGALENLYEDFGCQYFLVQADDRSRHDVPALTPQGFVHWLITMIQAYPDEEAKRLDKIVSALPIEADSLLDGKPERLPKQISRYLLPKEPVRKTKRLVDDVLNDFREDVEGSVSQSSKASSKSTPIIITATSEKRASASAGNSGTWRYVPDKPPTRDHDPGGSSPDRDRRPSTTGKNVRDDDKHRRNSMPAPPVPNKTGRTGSAAGNTRTGQSSRDGQQDAPGRVPSSASTRKNRSPQRNPYSQSAPFVMGWDDAGGDRLRSPGNIPAAAANVAGSVLGGGATGASLTFDLAEELEKTTKNTRNTDSHGSFRNGRASLDEESTPRVPASASVVRDKVDEESSSTSRSSTRRSVVFPDVKRPALDDYLKSSGPKSATPVFVKKSSTS